MLRLLAVVTGLSVLVVGASVARAQSTDCVATYYQTHDTACLDRMVAAAEMPPAQGRPDNAASALVGFFAALFAQNPAARQRILDDQAHPTAKRIYLTALVRAGLTEEARHYADAIGGAEGFRRYSELRPPTISQLVPSANPGDNDLLIGAYMASGNPIYVTHVLNNYLSVDDEMADVALREALFTSKFGSSLAPPGRTNTIIHAICEKYKCKQNPHDFLQVQTLASAFWAIQSLAQHDSGIRQCLVEFLQLHPKLAAILHSEQNGFSNYLTMLIAFSGIKDNAGINESLSIYEGLGTPADASAAARKAGGVSMHPVPH